MSFPEVYQFLDCLFNDLNELKIDVSKYEMDHICYRVSTKEKYVEMKESLIKNNELLIESLVGGRQIATFKLTHPVHFRGRILNCLELPEPKEGSHYKDGYEHVEFVIEESFEDFMKKYPQISFSTKGMQKDFNPELKVKLNDGRAVKFHHMTLEKVIEIEKST